jgi:choline dehydrogenase-like flavoprotein
VVGSSVCGSTTVNSGTCFRTPDDVLFSWARERRLPELHPKAMARHFERVESVLQVAPATPETLNGSAHVIARGCDALGYAHGPLHRNAPGCDGQGVCVFGCPTDAKRSTNVSYIPLALRAGALMVTGAEVDRVLTANGAAYGVSATLRTSDGVSRALTVRARRVVLSCGALYTPTLMMKSGLAVQTAHLGRHLSLHPATSAYARMPHEVNGHRGIPQGYAIEEFRHEGVMFEGAFTPLEFLALDLPFLGAPLVEVLEAYRHLAAFGIMVKDSGSGRVTMNRRGRPQVWYRLGSREVAILKRSMALLAEVFLSAGAEAVYLPLRRHPVIRSTSELRQFTARRLHARDFELTAYHPLGTARMASRAADGVVDSDHEVYGINRLHVVDASSVPSSLGVNPQVTIMAMATRAAERISDRLNRSLE